MIESAEYLIQHGRPFTARRALCRDAGVARPRQAHRLRRQLDALDLELAPEVGRAWFVFEAPPSSQGRGGLCRVTIHRGRSASSGPDVRPGLEAGARLAGGSADRLYATLWPAALERGLTGRSFELAVAAATWSRLTNTVLPDGVVFTGRCEEGRLVAPPRASCAAKSAVIAAELGRTGRLVIAGVDGPTLGAILGDTLGVDVGARPPLMKQVKRALEAYAEGRYADAARLCERAFRAGEAVLDADTLVDLARTRLAALTHEGRVTEALAAWRALAPHLPRVSLARRVRASAANAVMLLDASQADDAARMLDEALTPLLGARWVDASSRHALCELCGTRARVASALGDHAAARQFGERALDFARPAERARNLGDLALWQLRAGDAGGAMAWLERADEALEPARLVDPRSAATTAGFLRLFRARALLLAGDAGAASQAVEGMDPQGHLALALGLAEVRARLGEEVGMALAPIDASTVLAVGARVSAASRLRARIELRRPVPDLAAVGRWTGSAGAATELLATLDATLPY